MKGTLRVSSNVEVFARVAKMRFLRNTAFVPYTWCVTAIERVPRYCNSWKRLKSNTNCWLFILDNRNREACPKKIRRRKVEQQKAASSRSLVSIRQQTRS